MTSSSEERFNFLKKELCYIQLFKNQLGEMMFKKQEKVLEKEQNESSTLLSTLLETHPLEVEEALLERDLFDDHGPVILGDRKDPPVFNELFLEKSVQPESSSLDCHTWDLLNKKTCG